MLSWWLPESVSTYGPDIDRLFYAIYYVTNAVFFAVQGTLIAFLFLYRHRDDRRATYTHGNTTLEIVWTIAPLIIVLGIAAYSFVELQKNFQPITGEQMTVVVSGHQFGWEYDYDNGVVVHQEGSLTSDVTPFVVPVNTLVKLQFRGTDVIHSWWVPAISGKTDAVPGYDNFSWLKIDKAGQWRGECAELCGAGHASMQIIVQAMDQSEYDAWMAKQKSAASPSASPSPSK